MLTTTFDATTLRRSMEERDSATLIALYAENAELIVVDRDHGPANPHRLVGRDAIGAYFDDVCGRDMTHSVDRLVVDGDQAAYLETCTYPNGKQVRCAAVLDLTGGVIARQSSVQAWDE